MLLNEERVMRSRWFNEDAGQALLFATSNAMT